MIRRSPRTRPLKGKPRLRKQRRLLRTRATRRRAGTSAVQGARSQLRRFRQASVLALAITSLLLLLVSPDAALAQETDADPRPGGGAAEQVVQATREQATDTVRDFWMGLYENLPRVFVALSILVLAWIVSRLVRVALRRLLGQWERQHAITALSEIAVWVLAVGLSISVLAGDIRAVLGSVGLVGLALSWALQTPIESFTGWLLNSFRGYYRVGDRVSVGEVFGDIFRIDFLTTTVWEIGGPDRSGFVHAEQPTGRLITFPNNELLAGSVVNFTRDFPWVWDELAVSIANESDLRYAMQVLERVATNVVGESMAAPAREYEAILAQSGLKIPVSSRPETYLFTTDSWTSVIIRYLVDARQRRKWKTELILAVSEALRDPTHAQRIISVLPRQQLQLIGSDGAPTEWPGDVRRGASGV